MNSSNRKDKNEYLALFVFTEMAVVRIFAGLYSENSAVQVTGYFAFFIVSIVIVDHFIPNIVSQITNNAHPYGFKKYRSLVSLFVSMFFIMISLLFFWNILINGVQTFSIIPEASIYTLLLLSSILSLFILKYCSLDELEPIGFSYRSTLKMDVVFTLLIAISLFTVAEPLILMAETIFIILLVLIYCFSILVMAGNVLSDACCLDEQYVCRLVRSIEGIDTCYKVRTHGVPDDLFVDIHVKVRSDVYVLEASHIVRSVENKLKHTYTGISDVLVHIEPSDKLRST